MSAKFILLDGRVYAVAGSWNNMRRCTIATTLCVCCVLSANVLVDIFCIEFDVDCFQSGCPHWRSRTHARSHKIVIVPILACLNRLFSALESSFALLTFAPQKSIAFELVLRSCVSHFLNVVASYSSSKCRESCALSKRDHRMQESNAGKVIAIKWKEDRKTFVILDGSINWLLFCGESDRCDSGVWCVHGKYFSFCRSCR